MITSDAYVPLMYSMQLQYYAWAVRNFFWDSHCGVLQMLGATTPPSLTISHAAGAYGSCSPKHFESNMLSLGLTKWEGLPVLTLQFLEEDASNVSYCSIANDTLL